MTTPHAGAAWLLGSLLASTLVVAGCQDDDKGFDFATAGGGTAAPSDDGTAGSSGSGGTFAGTDDAVVDDSDATGAPGSDSGGSDSGSSEDDGDDDGLPVEPCIGLDILFVVDNSSTMVEEQMKIAAAAAPWLTMLNTAATTATGNTNVGVITTDEPAMVTATALPCNFASGLPYMQIGAMFDPVAFAAEVQCALSVGVAGSSDERPIEHLLTALSPAYVEAGGPNAGFLRDNALLVVVLLTDEEDDFEPKTSWGSAGDPPEWVASLAGIKGDIEKDVVVLSFIGLEKPNECPEFQWDGMTGAELSPRLLEFTGEFPAGAVHDICAADYTGFLNSVVPGVSGSCAQFSPP